MTHIENEEPYTDEDEKLAELLVDEAMKKFLPLLSAKLAHALREDLVDELLATQAGRRALARVKAQRAREKAARN